MKIIDIPADQEPLIRWNAYQRRRFAVLIRRSLPWYARTTGQIAAAVERAQAIARNYMRSTP